MKKLVISGLLVFVAGAIAAVIFIARDKNTPMKNGDLIEDKFPKKEKLSEEKAKNSSAESPDIEFTTNVNNTLLSLETSPSINRPIDRNAPPITMGYNDDPELNHYYNRIKALRKSHVDMNAAELTSYVSLAEEIIDKWSKSNPEYLARLLLPICGELTSARFNDDRQYELSRKYALIALENADQIPLNLEFELSGHVGNRRPIQDQNIFVERRKKNVSAWLHAWGRVENAIDPNWDPDEEIVVVMPTPGPEGFVGGDPKSIKDPKLRAQYERARLEKQKKIKHKTNQFRLRRWGQVILTHWEPNIVRAYSQPPYNMGELKQLLTEYQIGDEASNRIINAVKEQSQN